jgi:hypothetical protein
VAFPALNRLDEDYTDAAFYWKIPKTFTPRNRMKTLSVAHGIGLSRNQRNAMPDPQSASRRSKNHLDTGVKGMADALNNICP